MLDPGTAAREIYEQTLTQHINATYEEARRDIINKFEDFKRRYKAKDDILYKKVKSGEITQSDYNDWLRGQLFQADQWIAKRDQIIGVMSNANKIATRIANEQRGNVFIANSNYQAYVLEHGAGVNFGFNLYDSSSVSRLIRNWGGTILPRYKVDEPKDYIWNLRNVNNAITQGIIQGESLDKISKRLTDGLCTKNKNKMLTFARTGMTQAQNAGRLERLDEAKKLGIKVHKEWMATLDERTRTTHQMLDGQKVPINKSFKVDNYTIKYPGDPYAHPAMVYNCRCTLVGDLDDYPSEYERYDNIDGKPIKNMTYEEWKDAKSNSVVPDQTDQADKRSETIKRIMNSPTTTQMTVTQVNEFERLLNNMSDEHLEMYEAMTEFHANSNYIDGPGWYSPSERKVEMTLSETDWERAMNRPDIAAWKVKFHEEMHQLDHLLGVTQGYGNYSKITAGQGDIWSKKTPIGERLYNAIKKDIEDFMNNAIDYYNDSHNGNRKHVDDITKPLPPGARTAFFEYLDLMYGNDRESKASISAFTDAVGLFTNDRISPYSNGWWGHSPSYNKDRGPNGATSECWAEIGSHILRNDKNSLDILRDVMPHSVSEYESTIHEAAEYIKTHKLHY